MAFTAKAWGKAPSDYLPELGTYEKFVIDEVCAFVLAVEQEKIYEEAKKKAASKQNSDPLKGKTPVQWMMSDEFKSTD